MPPQLLFDISQIDLSSVAFDQEAVRAVNPQRGDMEQLSGVVWPRERVEGDCIVGFKDVRDDEFWVPGHIPGRPLLPGVLMIECARQVASFYTKHFIGWEGFIGFGGVEDCKFRQEVTPGQRLYMLTQLQWTRHRRIGCRAQGVVNGNIVFEAGIIGVKM